MKNFFESEAKQLNGKQTKMNRSKAATTFLRSIDCMSSTQL